jgi:prepilin-type N-terminal cleavage/methylation domain-containing protein
VVLRVASSGRSLAQAPDARCREGGFSLIEMLVTISIAGIVMATATIGFGAYSKARAESGTANNLVNSLRDAAERAQAEGRTYCVSFDSTTTWSVWRYACTTSGAGGSALATPLGGITKTQGTSYLTFSGSSFTAPTTLGMAYSCGTSGSCVYFYPRGVASAGSLTVRRSGSTKTYTVNVGGLTSRVYLS